MKNEKKELTLGYLKTILPKKYCKELFLNDYVDCDDFTMLNVPGDISDIALAYCNDILNGTFERIEAIIAFKDWTMASCAIMGHDEFCRIERSIKFEIQYPRLFKLILIWAWS